MPEIYSKDGVMFNIDELPIKLSKENYAATNYNDRLSCLNNFFAWLIKKGHINQNPLEDISRRRKKRKINSKRNAT
jgi:site-specific recombinase XerC